MSRHRVSLFALIAALALVMAACGGSDSNAEAGTSVTTAGNGDGAVTTSAPGGATTTTAAPAGNGEAVQEGDFVSVHYVGTLDDGEQFDSSRDRGQPLSFTVGSGQMIPGFDAAVRGMAIGDVKTVTLNAADAYGERSDDAIIEVPLAQVPEGTKAGDELQSGTGQTVTVLEVNGDIVTLDANHPLAGQALTFEIEIVSIGQ